MRDARFPSVLRTVSAAKYSDTWPNSESDANRRQRDGYAFRMATKARRRPSRERLSRLAAVLFLMAMFGVLVVVAIAMSGGLR